MRLLAALGSLCVLLGVGCLPSDETPKDHFRTFWQDFDSYYALFPEKKVDWDQVREERESKVSATTSDAALFSVFASMIDELRDPHLFIRDGDRRHPAALDYNFDDNWLEDKYLSGLTHWDQQLAYGWVGDHGYIRIRSWKGRAGDYADFMEAALSKLSKAPGLVIDIRHNSGGSYFNGLEVAGRLTAKRRHFMTSRFRDGPNHSDLSAPERWYVEPKGNTPFTGPVVALQDEHCFSASETFLLALSQLPNVTRVGMPTGGAHGTRIVRSLDNGLSFSVTVQRIRTPDGQSLEEFGIRPDHLVAPGARTAPKSYQNGTNEIHTPEQTTAETAGDVDPALEFALKRLRAQVDEP